MNKVFGFLANLLPYLFLENNLLLWRHDILVHGQVTIIFVVFVCLFVQSFSQPSSIRFGSN